MSINRVVISGGVTRDPEHRRTQSGMSVLSWGMAVNDRRRNQQTGEYEDYANYVDVTLFGNRADSLAGIIRKGMQHLIVEGKLRYSSWQANDGTKRSKLEVVADEVELPPKQQNGAQGNQGGAQGGYQQQAGGYAYGNGNAPQTAPQQPQYGNQYQREATYQPQMPQQGYGQQQQMPAIEPQTSVYDDDIPF